MAPRADVSEERRTQILEAALKVFGRLGLDKARMDDIVAEAGLSKGALYWYFKSKDDLILGILESLFDRELSEVRALVDAEGPARQRLLESVNRTLVELRRMLRIGPLLYEFYALAFRNKVVRKALRSYFHNYLAATQPLIEQGIKRGEFRAVDPQQAAKAIAAILEGTFLLWIVDPDQVPLEKQVTAGLEIFLEGLRVA